MNLKLKGIRPYSKRELAALYEMHPRSFFTLLKPHLDVIGTKIGRYYSIKQVEIIFERIGLPPCLLPDEYEIGPSENSYIKKRT
jgi:hypothetical protein